MKYLRVNYNKWWHESDSGSQTIYIDNDIKQRFNELINYLQTTATDDELKNYKVYELYYAKYLNSDKVQHLKLTQLRVLTRLLNDLGYNIKRVLYRNTRVVIK